MKNEHELSRCMIVELSYLRRVRGGDVSDIDEVCGQLYMDVLGHGINKEATKWMRN